MFLLEVTQQDGSHSYCGVTTCIVVNVYHLFGETCCHQLQAPAFRRNEVPPKVRMYQTGRYHMPEGLDLDLYPVL